jgi:hypothetical protein
MTQALSNPTHQGEPWDGDEELRRLIGSNDELSAIYRKLGYSVDLDQESHRILNQLKSLVGTEVDDPTPSGFGRLLYEARSVRFSQLHEREHKIDFDARRKSGKRGRVSLNNQAKQEHPEKLKAFLNRHPNAVRAISLLFLDKLEELFKDIHYPLSIRGREALLSAVTDVRTAVRDREGERDRMLRFLVAENEDTRRASLYSKDPMSALKSLDRAREHWCRLGQDFFDDDPVHERKAQLDELLLNSLWVREIGGQDNSDWHKDAAKQAKTYIDSTWMHTPWLTARFLSDLLDVELVPLNREANSPQTNVRLLQLMPISSWFLPQPWATFAPPILSFLFLLASAAGIYLSFSVGLKWAGCVWIAFLCWHYYSRFDRGHFFAKGRDRLSHLAVLLGQVRDEVDSGNYDAQEIAGRLRRYEGEGMYVHSLVYALLRLNSP